MAILPGSTLGILGGGQLGRMFVTAARTMGYEVMVLDPDPRSPAGGMASRHLRADYTDIEALQEMASECQVITTEFENIPATTLEYLSGQCPVHPSAQALAITQNRITEKNFIQSLELETSPFIALQSAEDLDKVSNIKFPAILKTATMGYDGKGQVICAEKSEVESAFSDFQIACILEQRIDLAKEVSVVLGRNSSGSSRCFPVAENIHENGILDVSLAPAEISSELEQQAMQAARIIADGLDYCGVLAIEFFISTAGQLLVNEIAPRPHNSGHFTLDACYHSQFEQQVRMICDLPAARTELHTQVAMLNLLGDIWPDQGAPDWDRVLGTDRAHLHLYGKKEARAGRKMGHINFLQTDEKSALENLQDIRQLLNKT